MTTKELIEMLMADYTHAANMIDQRAIEAERELVSSYRLVWLNHYSRQIFYKRIKAK